MRDKWIILAAGGVIAFLAGYLLGVDMQSDKKHCAERQCWEQEKKEIAKDVEFLRNYIATLRMELSKRDHSQTQDSIWLRQPWQPGIGLRQTWRVGTGYIWRTDDPVPDKVEREGQPCNLPSEQSTATIKERTLSLP